MARTALTVQLLSMAGLAPSYAAGDAVNHHQFQNDGKIFLHVKNAGAGALTVTIKTAVAAAGGFTVADRTVTVPATTGDRMIGPFDPAYCNQTGGLVHVDLSTGSGVTLAAIKMP